MLAGYGNYPDDSRIRPPGHDIQLFDLAEVDRFVAGCAMNYPLHRDALGMLKAAA